MKKIAAALALATLAGCVNDTPVTSKPVQISASDKAIVSEGISRSMRDPSSAQFRDWQAYLLSNGHRAVCVQVNGKNGFGGYVGFTQYYIRLDNAGTPVTMQMEDMAGYACRDAASNSLKINSAMGMS